MTTSDFPDKRRAILRAPLHVLMSVPFALASVIDPDAGRDYVAWRERAERDDFEQKRDSAKKARVDLVTQTLLVRGPLWVWRKVGL